MTTSVTSLFGDYPFDTSYVDNGADFFNTRATSHHDDLRDSPLSIPHTNYGANLSVAATIGSGLSSVVSASESLSVRGNAFNHSRSSPWMRARQTSLLLRLLLMTSRMLGNSYLGQVAVDGTGIESGSRPTSGT